jgi:hypothetical protein
VLLHLRVLPLLLRRLLLILLVGCHLPAFVTLLKIRVSLGWHLSQSSDPSILPVK